MTDSSEMVGESLSLEGKVQSLLQTMFPNHGPIVPVVYQETNDRGEECTVCKLSIAGEDIKCQGNFKNEQAAKDALFTSTIAFLETLASRKAEILPVFEKGFFEEGIKQIFNTVASLENFQRVESPFFLLSEEVSKSDKFSQSSSSLIKPLKAQDDSSTPMVAKTSYITFLTQYMQKLHPHIRYDPDFVSANHRFGCRYNYTDREYVVAAVYPTKQEAREALAKQICEHVIPSMFPQELTSTVSGTAADISPEVSGDFVSLVNIHCQKGNLSPPSYENIQEGSMWRVKVVFNDQTFISSAAYPKVSAAKFNVAKQLYEYINEKVERKETINKGGILEKPKLPVPGPISAQASPKITPIGVQPIPFMRPAVPGFQFQVGYPRPCFYGVPPLITPEMTSSVAAQIPSYPVSNLTQNPMAHMQQIPGIPSQELPQNQFFPTSTSSAPDLSQLNNPINHQQQQMTSLYYQQYMTHQMNLLRLQQQMIYQQQLHQAYPHSAPDGRPFSNSLHHSYPVSVPPPYQQVQDQNYDSYSLPPFSHLLNPQSPPPS